MTTHLDQLNTKSAKDLVDIYNRITGESVKRFSTRTAGLKRLSKALADADVARKLDTLLGVHVETATIVEFDDGTPIPSAGEVVIKAVMKKKRQPRQPRVAATAKAGEVAPTPTKNGSLVAFMGKVIRPDNVDRVKKGEVLWGAVNAPPAPKDQLDGFEAVNLNYPAKDKIPPPREGTQRAQLLKLMHGPKAKGVTIEQVSTLFGITPARAVYKLRDLHYVGGHGLRIKNGRVFAYGG